MRSPRPHDRSRARSLFARIELEPGTLTDAATRSNQPRCAAKLERPRGIVHRITHPFALRALASQLRRCAFERRSQPMKLISLGKQSQAPSAIELLKTQHEEVKALFKRIEKASTRAAKTKL